MRVLDFSKKLLAIALGLALSGVLQVARAQAAAPPTVVEIAQPQSSPAPPQQDPTAQTPKGGKVDPSQPPLQPVEPPPDSQQSQAPLPTAPAPQQNVQEPAGAAVGQAGVTAGGPASRPAGSAIAPAKQHQTRSLALKIGAVAAAGVALGTVIGLTRGTPSNPPGAH
jgi:hypothetical protein